MQTNVFGEAMNEALDFGLAVLDSYTDEQLEIINRIFGEDK
jgi:hypothetical protein